jgi:Undecaprenyl-phosphate glucose phosphotransferase
MTESMFNVVRLLRFPHRPTRSRLGADSVRLMADLLRVVDVVLLFATGGLLYLACLEPFGVGLHSEYGSNLLLATIFLPLVLEKTGCYKPAQLDRLGGLVRTVAVGCAIVFGGLLAVGFVTTSALDELSRFWTVVWFAGSLAGMVVARLLLAGVVARLRADGHLREAVAIVGAGPWGARLIQHLLSQRDHPVDLLGTFDSRMTRATSKYPPPDGTVEDLVAIAKTKRIDKIIVALPWSAEQRLLDVIHMFRGLAVDIVLSPDHIGFSLMNRPVDYLGELPLMRVVDRPLSPWRLIAKLVEDKVVAALALVLLSPILAPVALAVRLDSPGPVLFRQKRHGFNNTEFEVFKFRTMRWEATDSLGARQTRRGDARLTRIGGFLRRTSLDELPQLINVLRGDMSIVGPRPHPIGMRTGNRLCEDIVDEYAHRHRVKPGITGWAQVKGFRGATETAAHLQRRVELDLHYIDNWSIVLDVKIMLLTLFAVLRRDNAF